MAKLGKLQSSLNKRCNRFAIRTINYKYLQIFKSKKAFQRAQADEEDCKRGDSHTILELLKPTINDGTLKNPFSKPPSRKVDHFIKSITIGAMAASKRKDSGMDKRYLCLSEYDHHEGTESLSRAYPLEFMKLNFNPN